MKILIRSEMCFLIDHQYLIKNLNIDIKKYNSCKLESITLTSNIPNINEYNNKFILTENVYMTTQIELPIMYYDNYIRIASMLQITLNAQSINKNYTISFDNNTLTYSINANSLFSISFSSNLNSILGFSNKSYNNILSVESENQPYLYIDSIFLNFDFLNKSIYDTCGYCHNYIIPFRINDKNLLNNFNDPCINNVSNLIKSSNVIQSFYFTFNDYMNQSIILQDRFSILLHFY